MRSLARRKEDHPSTKTSSRNSGRTWPESPIIKVDAIIIGGIRDHVHALLVLPPTVPLAKAVQFLKGSSSKWIKESEGDFAWQEGYGAFSVSASQTSEVVRYIANQRAHHEKKTFEDEFLAFLKKYGIEYDPTHALG